MREMTSRAALLERRSRLIEAVSLLQQEIDLLNRELQQSGVRSKASLTEDFFWKQVFPTMVTEGEMTSADLRRRCDWWPTFWDVLVTHSGKGAAWDTGKARRPSLLEA